MARQNGIVVAFGPESPGFFSNCVRFLATQDKRGDKMNWRAGWARSFCGMGFSLLHYEATTAFHRRMAQTFEDFADNQDEGRATTIHDANPLIFERARVAPDLHPLSHGWFSFEHYAEPGFLKRLSAELARHNIGVVQYDLLMTQVRRRDTIGVVDHAMRCYIPHRVRGYAAANEIIQSAVAAAAAGTMKPTTFVARQTPVSDRGVFAGKIPVDMKDNLACIYCAADIRTPDNEPLSVDDTLETLRSPTELLEVLSDVIEHQRIAEDRAYPQRDGRPMLRLSMRYLGGWVLAGACVLVADENEASQLGVLLEKRLRVLWPETSEIRAEGRMSRGSPWSGGGDGVALAPMTHADRPRYLSEYFDYISKPVTSRVNVIQYDSWTGPGFASHAFCIAPRADVKATANDKAAVDEWKRLHSEWLAADSTPEASPEIITPPPGERVNPRKKGRDPS